MHTHESDPGPLAGVRVVDLSRLLPGPFCSWYLASLGAEVIRVEAPSSPDYTRLLPPLVQGQSVFFAAVNRGKRSVALDWRVPAGLEALRALIATADVLLEGFKPGRLAASGLDPDALLAAHPGLVIASISGYGQSGPWREEPGHDLNYLGYAGFVAALRANEGGAPDPLPLQIADVAGGGLTAALGIAAALFGRERTGRGRWLDISMTDGSLALMMPMLSFALGEGRDLAPGGEMLTGAFAAYRTYACADGELLCVGALEPKFLAALNAQLDAPVAPTPEAMAALFATRPRDEWVDLLQSCCVSPALRATELAGHPLHRGRDNFEEVLGVALPRGPFRWSRSAQAPAMGADTAAVLAPLGIDVEALVAAGAAVV
jgi:alpha-methylacyl-CoA racemase